MTGRVTVTLLPKAVEDMRFAATIAGDSPVDTVHRALRMYALVMEAAVQGKHGRHLRLTLADGTPLRLKLIPRRRWQWFR